MTKTNNKLKFKDIQLKDTQSDLIELNLKYDVLNKNLQKELESKEHNETKIKQLEDEKKRLESDQERLQRELQAKAKAKADARNQVASAASKLGGGSKVYAASCEDGRSCIYMKESGNCPTKWQGEHGACPAYHGVPSDASGLGYGLCQSTPASKMSVMGPGWETSYELQDAWCTQYANRYGGWAGAWAFWQTNHWW